MALGGMGLITSVYYSFNAMSHARHLLHGKPHHGGHHGKHGEHHGPPPPEEHEKGSEYVTKDEFELYDTVKTLCAISIFLMAKMIALGKCGKKMVWRNNSDSTKWLQKKSYICLVLIILTSIWASSYGRHIMKIVERAHEKHQPKEF